MENLSLQALKSHFKDELHSIYPEQEVQSFFALLSEFILNYTRYETVMNADEVISEAHSSQFQNALKRLKEQEPIQYIMGETEFYGLPFKVTPDTLIPRPETEELVSWVLSCARQISQTKEPLKILDIGTGSGCIAISLAKNLDCAELSALDFSEKALEIAAQNADLNEVSVSLLQEDVLRLVALPKRYDMIVSNPPYVRDLEKDLMQTNVLSFEPHSALFVSDHDPLVFYRTIAHLAKNHLVPRGSLFFEINEYLADELKVILKVLGYSEITIRKDLFGKDRMLHCVSSDQHSTD